MKSYSVLYLRLAFLLGKMLLNSIQVLACTNSSFIFIAELYSIVLMYQNSFNHLSFEGHWLFQYFAVTDEAAMNICV